MKNHVRIGGQFAMVVNRLATRSEREYIQRAVANRLGFRRLTETALVPIKSAVNSAICQASLGYEVGGNKYKTWLFPET